MVGERSMEFTLENGCPSCAGAVELRVSPEGARMVCVSCQTIARGIVRRTREGLEINYLPTAAA
jgi:hypothetical protein